MIVAGRFGQPARLRQLRVDGIDGVVHDLKRLFILHVSAVVLSPTRRRSAASLWIASSWVSLMTRFDSTLI